MRKIEKSKKRYRYICCGIAKCSDKICNFRLIGGNQLQNSFSVLRVQIPNDMKLIKYSCDNYSTTEDKRTLEELGCDVMSRFNGKFVIRNDLKHLRLCDIDEKLSFTNGGNIYLTPNGYGDLEYYHNYIKELDRKKEEIKKRTSKLKTKLENYPCGFINGYIEELEGADKEVLIRLVKMYINEKQGIDEEFV